MLSIRLQRTGKKHQPQFRVVLSEKQKHPTKKFLEILGNYNPRNKEFSVRDQDRVQYWIKQHVEMSPTVHNLFVTHGILSGVEKVKAWNPPAKEESVETAEAPAPAATDPASDATTESPAEAAPEVPEEKPAESETAPEATEEKA